MKHIVTSVLASSLLLSVSAFAADAPKKSSDKKSSESAGMTPNPDGVVYESWYVYLDQVDRHASTVYFDQKSAMIPSIEKMRLQDWANTYKNNNVTPKVVVASWSDKDYPKAPSMELSKSDKDLADLRNQSIKDALKEVGITSVETFNMAVRPNWFQRTFATDAAQIKGEAKDKHWDDKNEARMSMILKRRGGPSEAVLILRPVGDSGSLTSGR
ncbi:MAG: hypothetical protein H7249_02225 [Chitinophagaceae bacterium]|nr:hypothetical protein [Oligoflexus sp.]